MFYTSNKILFLRKENIKNIGKGDINHRGASISNVSKIFQKTDIYYPLIRTRTLVTP